MLPCRKRTNIKSLTTQKYLISITNYLRYRYQVAIFFFKFCCMASGTFCTDFLLTFLTSNLLSFFLIFMG